MRRAFLIVACFALLGACQRGAADDQTVDLPAGVGLVTKHTDGDTLRITLAGTEEKVRLIGIDTPETHGRGGLRECFGEQASEHLADLLPLGTKVRVERDAEARDRYGRLLAYVYRDNDDLFVNLAMAKDGYADVLTYPPNVAHTDDFVAAVSEARANDRGLWKACGNADVALDPE